MSYCIATAKQAHGWSGVEACVPNTFWQHDGDAGWSPSKSTWCRVVGACAAPYEFAGGAAAAYVIAEGAQNYLIQEKALRKLSKRGADGVPLRAEKKSRWR